MAEPRAHWKKRCAIGVLVLAGITVYATITVYVPYTDRSYRHAGGWNEVWHVQLLLWGVFVLIVAIVWALFQLTWGSDEEIKDESPQRFAETDTERKP